MSDKKDQSYTSWNSNSIILGDIVLTQAIADNMSTTGISGTGDNTITISGTGGDNTITLGDTGASDWTTLQNHWAIVPSTSPRSSNYTKASLSFSSDDNMSWMTSNTEMNNKISDLLMALRDLIQLCLGSSVLETSVARHFDTASQIINHNEIDVDELANLMEALKKRLLIIAPDFEKHEKYPMLKQLYDEYKALGHLLNGPDSNNDNE